VDDRLCILAFDHRRSLLTSFFGLTGEPDAADVARAREVKRLIWEGLRTAVATGRVPRAQAAALVDATYGADVLAAAETEGIRVAVPVEASGRRELAFEHEDWRERLAAIDPAWAKVLVRYNPDGDADMNGRQRATLRALTDHCADTGRDLMIELLVPPEPSQAGPTYDVDVRPGLMVRAILECREDGIGGDIWKIEGLERREDCARVALAAGAPCVVLGRGADRVAVERWLRAAAGVPGFVGFAIGRSIWWDALKARQGSVPDEDAITRIAEAYAGFAQVFDAAVTAS
jgi:5-dehydro-2-deoxygluconokinase